MEKRKANIIINNSGGNSGEKSLNYKVSLPSRWMNELNITKNNSEVEISFDGESITIKLPVTIEKFLNKGIACNHDMKRFNYYNESTLCTTIYADFTDKVVKIKNEEQPNILLAFGSNSMPLWEDFISFLNERCVPKSRDGIKYYLNELGLSEYNPFEIIKKTEGRMAEDKQWLEVIDLK